MQRNSWVVTCVVMALICSGFTLAANAQQAAVVLAGAELTRVTPAAFYFQGQSGSTQMRNTGAVRFGKDKYVIAGLIDTAGYAADVRERYQGFLITDSPVNIGGAELGTGAYGFGFTNDGKFAVLDLSGKEIFSVAATDDKELKRPRPLMMAKAGDAIRLYAGRSYVAISAK